ncbi:hypothetical protein GUITHDRAFT_117045 [Guillardia theta CCMP2712]|uniref:Uncharacterized protein n=1 Tax=Guillardia theta (strain CCMP2712) TaxID=905079 RepID=L1IKU3_GUITC|nr:hypothetical protein GUITHDRAFT_117045 [Guillardia theta CCMP2712]EKX36747.1 hypothetical protein GUITHDRAFT_117045 [Guillardia theta CCMP2712]|eukprot:XP_005823727.1 hypothetical protein GUITHDRAFT_117045 [Guillardia theta CCMP2712]
MFSSSATMYLSFNVLAVLSLVACLLQNSLGFQTLTARGFLRGSNQVRCRRQAYCRKVNIFKLRCSNAEGLRTLFSPPWSCLEKCGACCYLLPEERDLDCLSPEDRKIYIDMAGEDGWCKNFDKDKHLCRIYDERPGFCRMENIQMMYSIEEEELGDFAADACRDHIDELYGEDSITRIKFDMLQEKVRESSGWSTPPRSEEGDVDLEELLRTREELHKVIESGVPDDERTGMKEILRVLNEAIDAKRKET